MYVLLGAVNKKIDYFTHHFFDMPSSGADTVVLVALMAVTLAVVMIVLLAAAALAMALSLRGGAVGR
jgi:hypothetical protein